MIKRLNDINKEILERIEILMDDEKSGDSMTDKSRDILIKENQCFLTKIQGLMLYSINEELDKDGPTNWLGRWAEKKHQKDKL